MTDSSPATRFRFGGIAGVTFEGLPIDLGLGVTISETFATLHLPFLVNFDREEPRDRLARSPWMSTEDGGGRFKITAEIEIPEDFVPPQAGVTDVAVLWWLVALMRLRASTVTFMPLMSDESFSAPKSLPQRAKFCPLEIQFRRRVPESAPLLLVRAEDLEWVGKHWVSGTHLMADNPAFSLLILALDAAALASLEDKGIELLSLWGALESLFAPSRAELRFRVSALIATYLEPAGPRRRELQRHVARLYDARSKLAHTSELDDYRPVADTYALCKRVAVRILEENEVPTVESLEDRLFGT